MAKPRNQPRRDTDNEGYMPLSQCPDCAAPDPGWRARHHLGLVKAGGLDTLRAHLTDQYVKLRHETKERPDVVDDICAWAAGLMTQYCDMAHPETGATLPWWQARQYMATQKQEIARAAYERAPDKYKVRPANIGPIIDSMRDREPGEEG